MNNDQTPIGRAIFTVFSMASAWGLQDVNLWLSTIAYGVSITVGVLTTIVLVRKITKKGNE